MNDIASVISTVGFPIVSFLISAYFIKYTYDKQLEREKQQDEKEEKHWQELSKLTEAVNENSSAIRALIDEIKK